MSDRGDENIIKNSVYARIDNKDQNENRKKRIQPERKRIQYIYIYSIIWNILLEANIKTASKRLQISTFFFLYDCLKLTTFIIIIIIIIIINLRLL